jgi:hypothetical protein
MLRKVYDGRRRRFVCGWILITRTAFTGTWRWTATTTAVAAYKG